VRELKVGESTPIKQKYDCESTYKEFKSKGGVESKLRLFK
jgi:hypothetical protein